MSEVQQSNVPKSAKTVTVACKHPGGLILRLFEMYGEHEQVMGGGSREVKVARATVEPVHVKGCAAPVGGARPKHMIVGDYGLTPNVDAEFWSKWLEQNKDSQIVKNRLIFAMPTRDAAEGKAEEQAEIKSNLEPLDSSFTTAKNGRIVPNDVRFPQSASTNLSAPHTSDAKAA